MLLHDNYNPLIVSLQAVVSFHYKVKYTNCILYVKCISTMADGDKTLIADGNLSNNNRNSSVPNFVPPTSGTVQPETHPTHAVSEPSTLKRKQTSFQITSVTVKGSRLSTDGGEDSADDLDESHTEDANSDILDCSRTTDVDNDQLSEDNSNTNNDDSSVLAPSIPVKCTAELLAKHDAPVNTAINFPSESSKADKPSALSEITQSDHIVNPSALPDQWQHRFRVVKIVSSEPFKRGRWLCMDFMDPPAPAVEAKPEIADSVSVLGSQLITGTFPGAVPSDRVAHIYEISPSDAYPGSISVAVGPDQNQQPMYGIFLPVNHSQYPLITGIYSTAMPVHKESKHQETPQSAPSNNGIQQSQNYSAGQTVYTDQQSIACSPAQVMPSAAPQQSQKPAHPATSVQACTQHQSQTTVKAPTTTTQTAVSAPPIIPTATSTTTSQTVTSQTPLPPQSQVTQDSQLAMQQRMQTPTPVQSQTVPAVTTENTSSVVNALPTKISSTSQVNNASKTTVTSASSVQPPIHQGTSMPSVPQVTSVPSGQTQMQQITNASSTQSQVQQITSFPSVHQVQQSNSGLSTHTQVHHVTSVLSTQPQVQQVTSGHSTQTQVQQLSSGNTTQPQIQQLSSGPSTQSQVQQVPSVHISHTQVQQLPSGQTSQTQVQQLPSGHTSQSQVQQLPSGHTTQPQVQQLPSGHTTQPQVQSLPTVHATQSQVQQISSGPSTQTQVQQISSGPSTQAQVQQVSSGPSTQTQVQQISSGPSSQPQAQQISSSVQSQIQQGSCVSTAQPQVQQVNSLSSLHSQGQQINSVSSVQTQVQQVTSMPSTLTSSIGTQASTAGSIPEVSAISNTPKQEAVTVSSQVIQNHIETQELGTPPSNIQVPQDVSEAAPAKSDINGEDSESVPSGTSTVAIDNKIEQAMDLVKSHLMFAVREEVDVLKEKITELMDRISQLEYENGFLRANASQQTLEQLNQSQLLQQQQQTQPSTVSINSFPQVTQQPLPQQLNIQNQQSTS